MLLYISLSFCFADQGGGCCGGGGFEMEGGLLCKLSGGGMIMCSGAVFPSSCFFSVGVWLCLRDIRDAWGSLRKFSLVTLGHSVFILQSRHAWKFGHFFSTAGFRV